MRFARAARCFSFALRLGLSFALGGCLSGQTGSPDCIGWRSCVCDSLFSGGTLLRVHVERVESGKLEAIVDEVFAPPGSRRDVEVGDRVGGSVLAEKPCASDTPPSQALRADSELLVFYGVGFTSNPNCSTFQDCAAVDCVSFAEPALSDCWNACESRTQLCVQQRRAALLDGVFSWAIPWGDTLSFGRANELANSELSVLFTHERCVERFPTPPAPPCHDTGGACSATPGAGAYAGSPLALLLGLLMARRLRRRSTSQEPAERADRCR